MLCICHGTQLKNPSHKSQLSRAISQSDAILIITIIAINVTLTIIATIKGNQDLKRTKRLWKMCLKLLCLSMAVDGSMARLPNICKDFRFHNVHHSQS